MEHQNERWGYISHCAELEPMYSEAKLSGFIHKKIIVNLIANVFLIATQLSRSNTF